MKSHSNAPQPPSVRLLRGLQQWRGFLLFVLTMLIFRSAVADWNHVPSGSMVPTILKGDRILVDKLAYSLRVPFTLNTLARFDAPKRGHIVTFEHPDTGQLLVKRVMGLPGDQVQMAYNQLIINGEPAAYGPYAKLLFDTNGFAVQIVEERLGALTHPVALATHQPVTAAQFYGPVTIPADKYLMLGDNRDHSHDSRSIGLIDRAQITGRAHAVAFSIDFDNWRLRSKRLFEFTKLLLCPPYT